MDSNFEDNRLNRNAQEVLKSEKSMPNQQTRRSNELENNQELSSETEKEYLLKSTIIFNVCLILLSPLMIVGELYQQDITLFSGKSLSYAVIVISVLIVLISSVALFTSIKNGFFFFNLKFKILLVIKTNRINFCYFAFLTISILQKSSLNEDTRQFIYLGRFDFIG
jgi:hypothetical protein